MLLEVPVVVKEQEEEEVVVVAHARRQVHQRAEEDGVLVLARALAEAVLSSGV